MMASNPVTVTPETPVGAVACLMQRHDINSVVVCDGGSVRGIFTSRDLVRLLTGEHHNGATAAELMTPHPVTIEAGASFAEAMGLMDERRIRHLPVTEDGHLVGILSVRDLMHHRTRYLEEVVQQQTAELSERNQALRERDRVMQRNLELAGRIQKQLDETAPAVPPLSLAVAHFPHERVSGDLYDFALLPGDRVGVLIADARGHGVPAAFVSVMAKTLFRVFARRMSSPAALLSLMNDRLPPLIESEHFITMCYAIADRRTLTLACACAGHPPPVWCRRSGERLETLDTRGDMIGVHTRPSFRDTTISMAPDDRLLLYTDGLIELRDPAGEMFGRERAAAVLAGDPASSIDSVLENLVAGLRDFGGSGVFDDDVTCVGLQVGEVVPSRTR
jgi:sigma-B regulation protein RsbU (phosphoserine phosphatase)